MTGEPDDAPAEPWQPPGAGEHDVDPSGRAPGSSAAVGQPAYESRAPRRRRSRLVAVLAAGTAALVVAAGASVLGSGPQVGTVTEQAVEADGPTPQLGQQPETAPPSEVDDPEARRAAVERLLLDRGEAVRRDDARAWARQQVPGATTPDFADLAALPVARWTYTIDSLTSGDDPQRVTAGVTVSYRLDVDQHDATLREKLTLEHTDAGWRVAAEATEGRRQPWDLGRVSVVRGSRSVVIGIDSSATTLRRYASLADSVAADVTAVWGDDWSRRPVIVVPRTTAQLAQGLGRSAASLAKIAAVTTSEGGPMAVRGERAADRVWTNTPVMSDLSALGREIVLRHETLHAAVGAAATNATPLWLEEGLAQYVGYRGSGVPLRTAAGDVLAAVRAGTGPTRLPVPGDFSGDGIAEAYESAHVACAVLADEEGVAGLVRIYRLTAQGSGDAADNLDAALRRVTGQGTAELQTRWRARLAALAR